MKLVQYLNTVRYLKISQICFQLYYRIYRPKFQDKTQSAEANDINFHFSTPRRSTTLSRADGLYEFTFLNQTKAFPVGVDWEYGDFGKLWTYHLNYFDFLNDEHLSLATRTNLIKDYYKQRKFHVIGMNPYPIALRGINWIKFLAMHQIHEFDAFLYDQYVLLRKQLEYHLLGNHLLEDAYSLLFGAIYFSNKKWYDKASRLLLNQLSEQILADGGHFERSPMYHVILLERLLDCINLLTSNPDYFTGQDDLENMLRLNAAKMSGWLSSMQPFTDALPMVNDSSNNMLPTLQALAHYAQDLEIEKPNLGLGESGYRWYRKSKYDALIDIGEIGPDYIPGHAHADTFNTLLFYDGEPVLVEAGTSTYQNTAIRWFERGTTAHNTVAYDNQNSSQVWSAFRVARRAKVRIEKEEANLVTASHDGYKHLGILHRRSWRFMEDNITIIDEMVGENQKYSYAYFHFREDTRLMVKNKSVISEKMSMMFESPDISSIKLKNYTHAREFNKVVEAPVVVVQFNHRLKTEIQFVA